MTRRHDLSRTAAFALVVIIAASMALSLLWARVVPVFEAPDEQLHFDYAFSLATAGHLLRAGDNANHIEYNPDVAEFIKRVDLTHIQFQADRRIYAGYESPSDRLALNAIPTASPPGLYTGPHPIRSILNQGYPPGYYALAASALLVAGLPHAGMLSVFEAARSLSIVLLGIGLTCWYFAMRAAHIPIFVALFTIAVTAISPLTSFVSSYVQPDNLSFVLTGATLWAALRLRNAGITTLGIAFYALALAALWLTKYQFGLVLAVTTMPLVMVALARANMRSTAKAVRLILLVAPSVMAIALGQWSLSGNNPSVLVGSRTATSALRDAISQRNGLAYVVHVTRAAFDDFFLRDGTLHRSWWGVFGWLDTPLTTNNLFLDELTKAVLDWGTLTVMVLAVVAVIRHLLRMANIWRKRGGTAILGIVFSDPIPVSYYLCVALLFVLYVTSNNFYGAQGRDLYPFEPAAVLVTIWYGPKAIRNVWCRRTLGLVSGTALAVFALAYAPIAVDDLLDRYYSPPKLSGGMRMPVTHMAQLAAASAGSIDFSELDGPAGQIVPNTPTSSLTRVYASGWQIDERKPVRPVRAVALDIDGKFAGWGEAELERGDVAKAFDNAGLADSGFRVDLKIGKLKPGIHRLTLDFVDSDGDALLRPIPLGSVRVSGQ